MGIPGDRHSLARSSGSEGKVGGRGGTQRAQTSPPAAVQKVVFFLGPQLPVSFLIAGRGESELECSPHITSQLWWKSTCDEAFV